MGKTNCREKKCKRNCAEFNYTYDQSKITYAVPVKDQYPPKPGQPITLSTFGYVEIYDTLLPPNQIALLEFTNKIFIKSGSPGTPATVQINCTGSFLDGKTTISFILGFNRLKFKFL